MKWNNKSKYEIGLNLFLLLATSIHSSCCPSSSLSMPFFTFPSSFSVLFWWHERSYGWISKHLKRKSITFNAIRHHLSQSVLFDIIVCCEWCQINSLCLCLCAYIALGRVKNSFVNFSEVRTLYKDFVQASHFIGVCVTWNHVHKHFYRTT